MERDMKHSELNKQVQPDAMRRRLARGGVAGTVVLGSLISRPVLGAVPYHCTCSGQMSGNTSRKPDDTQCNTLGKSPGYWKNHLFPGGLIAGDLPSNTCSFSGKVKGTLFSGGYSVGGATFANAFKYKALSGACNVLDPNSPDFSSTSDKATMLQVLWAPGGLNDTQIYALGRAAVASLLNTFQFAGSYPLTAKQVIDMFNAVYTGNGKYTIPGSNPVVMWDRDQVKTYFESLYGGAD